MKKSIVIGIILIIAVVVGVVLFTNNSRDVNIDIETLLKDIIQNVKFEDEMNEANKEIVQKLYNIDNCVSQKVYISSGATAEEIAIFEFQNKDEVNNALEKANTRIEAQKENFENYVPKEINKLENAIIVKKDRYLIICITEDENAQKIIDKYIK